MYFILKLWLQNNSNFWLNYNTFINYIAPEPFPLKLPGVDGVSGGKMLERANLANKSRSGGGEIGGG
jgi:hypothetical protein